MNDPAQLLIPRSCGPVELIEEADGVYREPLDLELVECEEGILRLKNQPAPREHFSFADTGMIIAALALYFPHYRGLGILDRPMACLSAVYKACVDRLIDVEEYQLALEFIQRLDNQHRRDQLFSRVFG